MQNSNKMNSRKILHVMILDKFLPPYIDFIDEHFGREGHHYVFITSEKYQYGLTPEHKVEFLHTDDDIFITLLAYMKMAKKIILHGLWRDKVDVLLYFNQELLKKCYWVMWGGDFYFPETKNKIRHEIIKKMGYCIPVTYGDFLYIQSNYCSSAKYCKCINYPRSIKINNLEIIHRESANQLRILVGNSATPTNRHVEIFNKLMKFKSIDIFVPLSYGDNSYMQQIMAEGKKVFRDNFYPLVDMMEYDDYLSFLNSVDIAIFNHSRQQAVGNIILLLLMGKTIYLSKDNNAYEMLKKLEIIFKDTVQLNYKIEQISLADKIHNQKVIMKNYSEERAFIEWSKIFE
jgi:hypothetical protein